MIQSTSIKMLDLEIFKFEKINWIKKTIFFFKRDPET